MPISSHYIPTCRPPFYVVALNKELTLFYKGIKPLCTPTTTENVFCAQKYEKIEDVPSLNHIKMIYSEATACSVQECYKLNEVYLNEVDSRSA